MRLRREESELRLRSACIQRQKASAERVRANLKLVSTPTKRKALMRLPTPLGDAMKDSLYARLGATMSGERERGTDLRFGCARGPVSEDQCLRRRRMGCVFPPLRSHPGPIQTTTNDARRKLRNGSVRASVSLFAPLRQETCTVTA